MEYKVLVIGNDSNNQSTVYSSSDIDVDNYFIYQPGFSVEVFWRTPAYSCVGNTFSTPNYNVNSILPDVTGTSAMIVTFPPVINAEPSPTSPLIDLENIIKEVNERLPGLAETFESEPPGYHLTNTIDYVMLLEGELTLFLDNDKHVELKPGNIVVQNGTRHAWVNNSNKPARLLVIMLGVERHK